MSTFWSRLLAVVEVIAVFIVTRFVIVFWLIPALGLDGKEWATRFLAYALWIAVALLMVLVHRPSLEAYGLDLGDFIPQVKTGLSLWLPFALAFFVADFLLPGFLPRYLPDPGWFWPRRLLSMLVWIALLWWLNRLLDHKIGPTGPARQDARMRAALPALILVQVGVFSSMTLGERLTGFVFYLLFLGPGEEVLYRGYMQSRLNAVFGRPYHLLGANWGWGLVIATLLFGLMHAFNGFNPAAGQYRLDWSWAAGATVAGFVFAWLRERTGSVIPGSLMHGLPQAVAALFMRF